MLDRQLFGDGVEIAGHGAVAIDDGKPYFMGAGFEPPEGLSDTAIALTGSTAEDLVTQVDPASPWVAIRGRWQGRAIELSDVELLDRSPAPGESVDRPVVPCDPPSGGWVGYPDPRRAWTDEEKELRSSGVLVSRRSVEIEDGSYVFVFLVTDRSAATAVLHRLYDANSICVAPTRWTADKQRETMRALIDDSSPWADILFGFGESPDADGQNHIVAEPLAVTDELERWLQDQPDGLVELQPALWELDKG
ncbi:MAG: hypothetical protein WBG53_00750 [Rhodococcus sp. (in: high G+C Gram-positive bacteria)]|uniref:hypothetical protein n=1 Tax=Rhodococcus sp. SBT000017 TaxID=1803385 RepID=UPI000EF906BD|nr:hypothetical protein [Rhodococcus sp. SBT000017]RMB76935.1 hypothetical protein AYK61_10960 [Rhodococcus sp. SBT000017]